MLRLVLITIVFTSSVFSYRAQEICDNGIDDDNDGLVDLNDIDDCSCVGFDTVEIQSLIPNASFEDMLCCPSSYSQLNCADSWIQASDATSDYLNTCGFVFGAMTAAGLTPMPDGNGCVGAIMVNQPPLYLEYVGACTNTPMLAGQSYTLNFYIASVPITGQGGECSGGNIFYGDIDITLYGNTNCGSLPWAGFECPAAQGWEVLGAVTYSPVSTWGQTQIIFTPTVDINAIALGAPCVIPPDYIVSAASCFPYFFYDDLHLAISNSSPIGIVQNQANCNYGELVASIDTTGGTWQWFNDGVAIIGQTDSILDLDLLGLQDGNYTAVYSLAPDCESYSLNVPFIGPDVVDVDVVACDSFYWDETGITITQTGIYTEVLQNIYGCDSTITLNLTVNKSYSNVLDTTICIGEQVTVFGVNYNQTGIYYDTTQTFAGCDSSIILDLNVVPQPDKPILEVIYPGCAQDNVQLLADAQDSLPIFWSGPNGYQGNGFHIEVPVSIQYSGAFSAVVSNDGCYSDTAQIIVNSENLIVAGFDVPNVITADENGVNEYIDIRDYYPGCEFKFIVLDRWGIVVFVQTQDSAPFNGRDKKGHKLGEGTYFYSLSFEDEQKHGYIQIVK